MKIAGQKNDGAWFRANKFITNLGEAGQAALSEKLRVVPAFIEMWSAASAIADLAGYAEPPAALASVEAWADQLTTVGIPRQVWLGVLTWDEYSAAGTGTLAPVHGAVWRQGAHAIRVTVTKFRMARRQLLDFANEVGADDGNPGGIADANIET